MLAKKIILTIIVLSTSALLTACSPRSLFSSTAAIGGAIGAGAGAIGGAILAKEEDSISEKEAIVGLAAVAAAIGSTTGALVHENEQQKERQKYVVRQGVQASQLEKKLDKTRDEVYDSTSWGKAEIKPWEDRFETEPSRGIYQGPNF